MKKLFILLMMISSLAFANDYDEGVEYLKLKKPVATNNPDKVEVREVFLYTCPSCYRFEPLLQNWKKNKPENVDFVLMPVMFSPFTELGAIQYYTLQELELLDILHVKLYDAIHKNRKKFDKPSFANWVASFSDFSSEKVLKVMNSFAVRVKVNKASVNTLKYNITGVPSMVVNGKYTTNATLAGSHQEMLKVVNFLVKKESIK